MQPHKRDLPAGTPLRYKDHVDASERGPLRVGKYAELTKAERGHCWVRGGGQAGNYSGEKWGDAGWKEAGHCRMGEGKQGTAGWVGMSVWGFHLLCAQNDLGICCPLVCFSKQVKELISEQTHAYKVAALQLVPKHLVDCVVPMLVLGEDVAAVVPGLRVARGRDWQWGDQDGIRQAPMGDAGDADGAHLPAAAAAGGAAPERCGVTLGPSRNTGASPGPPHRPASHPQAGLRSLSFYLHAVPHSPSPTQAGVACVGNMAGRSTNTAWGPMIATTCRLSPSHRSRCVEGGQQGRGGIRVGYMMQASRD